MTPVWNINQDNLLPYLYGILLVKVSISHQHNVYNQLEGYENLRPLSYPNSDVILVCFSCIAPDSFDNVKTVWVPEIKQHVAKTPIVLCGLKTDLRNDRETLEKLRKEGQQPVTKEQGEKLAKELKAVTYVECSAFTGDNLQNVFQTAILVGLNEYKPGSSSSNTSSNNGGCLVM